MQQQIDDFMNMINVEDFASEDSSEEDESKTTKDSESSSDEVVPNVNRLNLRIPVFTNNN